MESALSETKMQLSIGTSGFSYAAWKGKFYPERLPAKQMLSYYAERFPPSRSTTPSTACPRPR